VKVNVNRAPMRYNQFRWPERLARKLGKVPDQKLAREAGVHPETVVNERRRRGIPPSAPRRPRIEWTRPMLSLLGTGTDKDVAAELGLDVGSVSRKRKGLGIEPYGRPSVETGLGWSKREDALLGTAPDHVIARRIHKRRSAVAYRRMVLEVPPFLPAPPAVKWTKKMRDRLGELPDSEIARRFGISVKGVRQERKRRRIAGMVDSRLIEATPELSRLLRERESNQVAKVARISHNAVGRLRKTLSIPPPKPPSPWTNGVLRRLGRDSDTEIARQLGLTAATVAKKRQEIGGSKWRLKRWAPREDAVLGTLPDREAARRLGRTYKAVKHRRHLLGIEPIRVPR
jgi:DNA-binding CsgD family transcriptional regulator